MRELEVTLDEVFTRPERLTSDEIQRRAVAADAPIEVINALDGLPEGEYAQDEVAEALDLVTVSAAETDIGVPPDELDDDDLMRELADIHRTRHDTLRHGSDDALIHHTARMAELESEYLRRLPQREVDPERLREGARQRRNQSGRIIAVEDSEEVERAVEDETPVASLAPETLRQSGTSATTEAIIGDQPGTGAPPRSGRRSRTGAEQPWEPRDFAIAAGRDPTPENIEWARRVLAEEGPSAIERTVP